MSDTSRRIQELESQLAAARERLKRACRALEPKHKGGEMEEFEAARAAVLTIERDLAAAKGEQYAVPLHFPLEWSCGAPLPHLLMNDHKALLTFYLAEVDPKWDGTYVISKSPSSGAVESLGMVEFQSCIAAKLGSPNDETFDGHPLSGRGMEAYTSQVVMNSQWIAELQAIDKIHPRYDPSRWIARQHDIFWFHDTTFECIAESYRIDVFKGTMPELLAQACARLVF